MARLANRSMPARVHDRQVLRRGTFLITRLYNGCMLEIFVVILAGTNRGAGADSRVDTHSILRLLLDLVEGARQVATWVRRVRDLRAERSNTALDRGLNSRRIPVRQGFLKNVKEYFE